ncbi:MAG: hypothetical protein M1546_25940 [Chloroflexi bacterium]|nr:hypothetical protein [Chloroflexota bacterium]
MQGSGLVTQSQAKKLKELDSSFENMGSEEELFGDQQGWVITFDNAYWDTFTFKSKHRPDPGQLDRLIARAYHGEQITFPVEIEPG